MQKVVSTVILFLAFASMLGAQSDATPKGMTGFEAAIGVLYTDGPNPALVSLAFSMDGELDLGLGYTGVKGNTAFVLGGAYHIGGEANKAGLSLNAGYALFSNDEDYFVYGPGVYGNFEGRDATLIPSINFEFVTREGAGFTGILAFSVISKGKVAAAFRPGFAFNRDTKSFFFTIGLLTRS